jgi:hypothetical protein
MLMLDVQEVLRFAGGKISATVINFCAAAPLLQPLNFLTG